MNFVVGFLLLVNGGKDEEAFWFLAGLLELKSNTPSYSFDPL
jgi:hypothetical protein